MPPKCSRNPYREVKRINVYLFELFNSEDPIMVDVHGFKYLLQMWLRLLGKQIISNISNDSLFQFAFPMEVLHVGQCIHIQWFVHFVFVCELLQPGVVQSLLSRYSLRGMLFQQFFQKVFCYFAYWGPFRRTGLENSFFYFFVDLFGGAAIKRRIAT